VSEPVCFQEADATRKSGSSNMKKAPSSSNIVDDLTSIFGGRFAFLTCY